MQNMIQAMQIQYADAPQSTHQDYGGRGYYGGQNIFWAEENVVLNIEEIGEVDVAVGVQVI